LGHPKRHRRSGDACNGLPACSAAVVIRLYQTQAAMTRTRIELVREGKYAAEVSIELIEQLDVMKAAK
jgi:hypothetical protein